MITRLEIDGFKTFRSFAIDIAPFQVIVGANNAGVGNLFDAIGLLAALVDGDIATAADQIRGGARALFARHRGEEVSERMRLAVEMLVEPTVEDRWLVRADVRYTRMRYEVEIAQLPREHGVRGDVAPGRFAVVHEALLPIQRTGDRWARRFLGHAREPWLPPLKSGRSAPFISTEADAERGAVLYLHQDGRGGEMAAMARGAARTVLSTIANTEFPHACAAREEMRRWRTIHLSPPAIRGAGVGPPHSFIGPDGGNLTAALVRVRGANPAAFERIGADAAALAPTIAGIALDEREGFYRQRIDVATTDGMCLPASALGDADLRLVTLATLANDPDGGGVLAIDEPENGLDDAALARLAPYLRSMSTDLMATAAHDAEEGPIVPDAAAPGDRGERLRQVIVATHSLRLVHELVRVLTHEADVGSGALPQLVFAWREAGQDTSGTRCAVIRPSQQLELELHGESADGTPAMEQVDGSARPNPDAMGSVTLADVVDAMDGRGG